jgi:predicted DNA binding CopG/RHH family protein
MLDSVERGEGKAAKERQARTNRLRALRQGSFRKDRRLNTRLSNKDLEPIQKRALAEGLLHQTLISSVLHKYASRRLKEI